MNDLLTPWETLSELIVDGTKAAIIDFLDLLGASESARAISRLSEEEQHLLFSRLGPEEAADLIEGFTDTQAADIVETMPFEQAAAILDELPSDQLADVLAEMDDSASESILASMEKEGAAEARMLLTYAPDCAGGLMISEFLAFRAEDTIRDVLKDLQENQEKYNSYNVQYFYVVDSEGRLTGVMRMHNLLFYSRETRLGDIMIPSPLSLPDTASLQELKNFFEEHKLFGVPVVDGDQRLVGVVLPSAVEEEFNKQKTKAFLRLSGIIGGEEFRTMPLLARSGRRLSWLSMNIVLNIMAASVIALYQDTLAAAITLAVFLPMVSDMSGCSGNQAVAVSMRELALGLVKPGEILWVVLKEARVGIINGVVLGILLGLVAFFWQKQRLAGDCCWRCTGGKHPCLGDFGRRVAASAEAAEDGSRPGFQPAADNGNRYVRFLFCAQFRGSRSAETLMDCDLAD